MQGNSTTFRRSEFQFKIEGCGHSLDTPTACCTIFVSTHCVLAVAYRINSSHSMCFASVSFSDEHQSFTRCVDLRLSSSPRL